MIRNRRKGYSSPLSNDRETTSRLAFRSNKGSYEISRYDHMLNEDVNVGIMPYRNHTTQSESAIIKLSSPNALAQEDISLALSGDDYYRDGLEETVSDFIRKCAVMIMHEGQAIYELVHYTNDDSPEASFSKLERVPNGNIKFILGFPFQILPKPKEFEDKQPRFKKITKNKLILFKMPTPYRSSHKAWQFQLNEVGKYSVQNLYMEGMERANKSNRAFNPKINVMEGYKFSDLAALSATNAIGWNARDTQSKYLQEYFTLIRLLRFEAFKIDLRNSILKTINDNLNHILSDSKYAGKLEFHGLPTIDDIKEAEEDLRKGNKKFNDIIDPFLKN